MGPATVRTLVGLGKDGEIGEPDEVRGSCPVLGEPRGAIPRGYSLQQVLIASLQLQKQSDRALLHRRK